jgi:hypothetical protein
VIDDLHVQELADQMHGWLGDITSNLGVPDEPRARAAAALLYGALAHFNAICFLAKHAEGHPSAFALLRVQWQALLNGLWMHSCCPQPHVKNYVKGRKQFPHFNVLISEIEVALGGAVGGSGPLSQQHAMMKESMHNFTHMGSLQIAAISGQGVVGTAYPQMQIDGLLITAVRIMLITVAAVAQVSGAPSVEQQARDRFVGFHDELARRLGAHSAEAQTADYVRNRKTEKTEATR